MKLDTQNSEENSLPHAGLLRCTAWKARAAYGLTVVLPLSGIILLAENKLILGLACVALVFAVLVAYLAQRSLFVPLHALLERLARLEQISIADSLTGLANRRYFDERLEVEFARAFRHEFDLSLLILDIDRFERIDGDCGRAVAEQVMLAVAQATQKSTRNTDLCARYDGEKFVVMLPFTNREQAAIVAEKIRGSVAATPIAGMANENPSVSIGLACYPDSNALSLEELWAHTGQALNSAKESGGNRVVLA